ncbi:MAG: family 43 glycosylhydrolase, partial [Clostridia bacterium]|nr:family 43 glycosylhydrolase [Clostridia bacterium]
KIDGKWYIYASGATSMADKGKSPSTSIRLFCLEATSDDPYGDYVFKAWLNEHIFAIDAHAFTYKDKNYIAFARCGSGNHITVAELTNPWTINPTTVRTISSATLPFETMDGKVNEGPFTFVSPDGRLFMLYSANNVTSDYYCLGLLELTGDNVITQRSWTKLDHAVLEGTAQIKSPGHCSVFMSPDGTEYWLAYHFQSSGRKLAIGKITFDESGDPVFTQPTAPKVPFFGPSEQ